MVIDNLHWLGHSAFRFDGSKIIYFDPWRLSKSAKKADIIFISHEHFDHFSQDDIALISSATTLIITDKAVARQLQAAGGKYKEAKGLSCGDSLELSGVKVQALPAYNLKKEYHPKSDNKLGFIVGIDGITIYHAGDTDSIPEMSGLVCDVALLPVSGTYVMTAEEAAQAALLIKPKIAVPMHYGDIVGSSQDALRFQDILRGKIEVKILKKE